VLERRVGTGPDVADLTGQIGDVRREKEAAISAQDFEGAAARRDREKQLAAERDSRWEQWSAAHQDLPSLSEEVERLRGLLRQHGLDAEDGTA
jgi:UvrB/uvrC motif